MNINKMPAVIIEADNSSTNLSEIEENIDVITIHISTKKQKICRVEDVDLNAVLENHALGPAIKIIYNVNKVLDTTAQFVDNYCCSSD